MPTSVFHQLSNDRKRILSCDTERTLSARFCSTSVARRTHGPLAVAPKDLAKEVVDKAASVVKEARRTRSVASEKGFKEDVMKGKERKGKERRKSARSQGRSLIEK